MNLHLWSYLECLQLRGHFFLGGEILFERTCILGGTVHLINPSTESV